MTNKIIPTKINRVNLNSFVNPMKESLNIIEVQLQSLSENNMDVVNFKALELLKNANDVKAALKISNAYAEAKLVKRYCRLLEIIEKGSFQKQTDFKEAVSIALMVNYQLITHIEKLSENPSYYAANLWKSWSKLGVYFVEDYISINELFSPCGNFNDFKFVKAKREDIEKLINGVISDYKNAVLDYETTSLKDKALPALTKIFDTINILLNIKSSHNYHEYWSALKARIQCALSDPNYELDNKKELTEIVKSSEVNLVNFSSGSTKLNHLFLEKVCSALLSDNARSLSLTDPVINEFYQRFYINDFLEEADKIVLDNETEKNIESDNLFSKNIKDIRMDLLDIAKCWKDNENNMQDKKMLLIYIYNFIDKKSLARFGSAKLENNELKMLLKNYFDIYAYFFKLKTITDVIPHNLSLEYASLHILMEYYLKRKGNTENGFLEMVLLCSERLEAALNKDFEKLESLPKLEWKGEVKKSLDKELKIEIMEELKKNLNKIKRAYKDFSAIEINEEDLFNDQPRKNNRNTKEIKEALKNIVEYGKDLSFSSSLLQIIGYENASSIVKAICFMINSLGANGTSLPSKESSEIFSLSLGAFEIFLDDVIDGSEEPELMLEHAFKRLYKDENFTINIKSDDFVLKPLIEKEDEDNKKESNIESFNDLIANEKPLVPEKEDILPKFNEFRNSENFATEEPKIQVKMEIKQAHEQNKENEEKIKEAKKKKEELTPRFISYDPDDEEYYVEDYLEEILDEQVDINFKNNIEKLRENPRDIEAFKEIRRMFHSWKGSGKQVNMYSMGYVGEELNFLFDKRMDMDIEWNPKIENASIVAYESFKNWAIKLSENKEVYFDPSEVFSALKEEEEFYQANYAKENKLILETELKENVEFSLPTEDEILNLSKTKNEGDKDSIIEEKEEEEENKDNSYSNVSYKDNEINETKPFEEQNDSKVNLNISNSIHIEDENDSDDENKGKVSKETISIDSIAQISAEFVDEDNQSNNSSDLEFDQKAQHIFDNVINNNEEIEKTNHDQLEQDVESDKLEKINIEKIDYDSNEKNEISEEKTLIKEEVVNKEEGKDQVIEVDKVDVVNEHHNDEIIVETKIEQTFVNEEVSTPTGNHNEIAVEKDESLDLLDNLKYRFNEEIDLINQNLMVSKGFSEYIDSLTESDYFNDNKTLGLKLLSSIFEDLVDVDLTDYYADEINEVLMFVVNNIENEDVDLEIEVKALEDKIFEKTEIEEKVEVEKIDGGDIKEPEVLEYSSNIKDENNQNIEIESEDHKLDQILNKLILMKKELNDIKEILTDIN